LSFGPPAMMVDIFKRDFHNKLVYFIKYGNLENESSHSFPKLLGMDLKLPHPCPSFLQT